MTVETTISQMCKSARAMGLSKGRWLNVEDHLTRILRSSGPEFTIQYLKDLKEYMIAKMVGDHYELSWHKKTATGSPAGWQASLTNFAKPKTAIQVLGALINAVELDEMSSKQYNKWHAGVRVDRDQNQIAESTSEIFNSGRWVKKKHQTDMSRDFLKAFAANTLFGLKDLTGKSIPVGADSVNVAKDNSKIGQIESRLKRGNLSESELKMSLLDLVNNRSKTFINAWLRTLSTSPVWAANLEIELIDICDKRGIPVTDRQARLLVAEHVRKYNDDVPSGFDEWAMDDFGTSWSSETSIYPGSNGHVAFLQQPGGKLRTICNPNRYSQHVLRPLQSAMFNHNFMKMKTNAVFCQEDGIRWAQHKLREGHELASMDLSAATDLLNSQEFIRNALVSHLDQDDPLTIALEYFEIAAKGNWEIPALNRQISFTEGQPLGLGPSFPMLTLQNTMAAMLAVEQGMEDGVIPWNTDYSDCFRVVGDDMIIISELKDYYANNISSMGGEANPEKALLSSRYAEFCSQMITAQGSWPLKPKIRGTLEYVLVDAETATSLAGLMSSHKNSKKLRFYSDLAEALSEYSGDSSLRNIPSITGSNHVSDLRKYASSLVLEALSQERITSASARSLSSKSQLAAYLLDPTTVGNGWTSRSFRFLENLGRVDTSVDEIPTRITEYNHKTGLYEDKVVDPVAKYRELRKTLNKFDVSESKDSVVISAPIPSLENTKVEVVVGYDASAIDLVYTQPTVKSVEKQHKVVYSRDVPGLAERRKVLSPRSRVIPTVQQAMAEESAKHVKSVRTRDLVSSDRFETEPSSKAGGNREKGNPNNQSRSPIRTSDAELLSKLDNAEKRSLDSAYHNKGIPNYRLDGPGY